MKTDSLRSILSQVETYCAENELLTFQGALLPNKKTASADWEGESLDDWETFLSLAKKSGAKIIYVDKSIYEVEESELERFSNLIRKISEEEKAFYTEKLASTRAHLGTVERFTFDFNVNDTCHTYYAQELEFEDPYGYLFRLEDKPGENLEEELTNKENIS